MFGRAFIQLFGAALLTRGFWAILGVLVVIGLLIQNPVVAIALAVLVLVFGGIFGQAAYAASQSLPINGVPVSVKKFQCTRCGEVGRLRVERRPVVTERGPVKWPTVVCRKCGMEEAVPGRVV